MNRKKKPLPGSCDWVPEAAKDASGASCDWAPVNIGESREKNSTLRKFADYAWEGVEPEQYKAEAEGWAAIGRHVLVAGAAGAGFDLRYFEIAGGGHSSLEAHRHAHVVIGIRGRGRILLGGEVREIGFLDLAYIAPEDPHQLLNPHPEPFGFFCLVDHDRDRPRPLAATELQQLLASAAGAKVRP